MIKSIIYKLGAIGNLSPMKNPRNPKIDGNAHFHWEHHVDIENWDRSKPGEIWP